jgi:hypothetical protein
MTKSLLTGMAVCAALAVFAGNADAQVHKAHVHKVPVYGKQVTPAIPMTSDISLLRAKGGPLHDCVHVTFPQCSRGYGEPND